MKKVKISAGKRIKVGKLYRDDLTFLENIFVSLDATDLKIGTPGYEYDSIAEIKGSCDPTNRLEIRMYSPEYVSVTIENGEMWFYANDSESLNAKGAQAEIERHFRRSKWSFWQVLGSFVAFLGPVSLGSVPVALLAIGKERLHASKDIALSLLFVTVVLILFSWWWNFQRKIVINFAKKRGSFFKIYKDQIILGLAFAIVGAIAGALATRLVDH